MVEALRFGILGPLEARRGDALVTPSSRLQCLVLVRLLVADGPVSEDALAEVLWGDHVPPTAVRTLRSHVSRLRGVLGAGPTGPVVVHSPGGYALRPGLGSDAAAFEDEVAQAHAAAARADGDTARSLLERALQRWRGEVLTGFRYEPFAQPVIARLEALRLTALEDRIALDLDAGHATDVVPELRALTIEHPLRERFHWLHMLALHRSGQTGHALDAYQHARRVQIDQLGLEPSTQLRALQQDILTGTSVPAAALRRQRVGTAERGQLDLAWDHVRDAVALPDVDDELRGELLLARGAGLRRAGRIEESRQAYAAAVRLATAADRGGLLALAALGFVGPPEDSLSTLPIDEDLIERALLRLPDHRPVVSRLRARLAVGLIDRGEHDRGEELLASALRVARTCGDQPAVAHALRSRLRSWFRPEDLDARLAAADELLAIGGAVADADITAWAHRWRVIGLVEAARLDDADAALDELAAIVEDAPDAFHRWFVVTRRVGIELLREPTQKSEHAVLRALALTDQVRTPYTTLAGLLLLWTTRWLQGRTEELAELSTQLAPALPDPALLKAFVDAERGYTATARDAFEHLAGRGFGDLLARDRIGATSLFVPAVLAETAAHLGDAARAEQLFELLRPFSGRFVPVPPGVTVLTTVDHCLGRLAATTGDAAAAEAHFRRALALCDANSTACLAPPTQAAYAALLRRDPARKAEADAHDAAAIATATRLGLKTLEPPLASATAKHSSGH